MLGLPVIPSLLMCFGLWFLFETPRWLVFHGKSEKARKAMEKIRTGSAIDEELFNIQEDYELSLKNSIGLLICMHVQYKHTCMTLVHAFPCNQQILKHATVGYKFYLEKFKDSSYA